MENQSSRTLQSRRRNLYSLLGELPPRRRPVSARTVSVERRKHYVLETLELDLNGIEPVPAYFVRPLKSSTAVPAVSPTGILPVSERGMGVSPMCSTGVPPVSSSSFSMEGKKQQQRRNSKDTAKMAVEHMGETPMPLTGKMPVPRPVPRPTVLYNHAHGGYYELGKDELLLGHRTSLQDPPYAELLTSMGYSALCIDHWGFGARYTRREGEIFREMLWRGRVMWGMMVYDSLRAVDYLRSRGDVDAARIGTLGLSMGSTMAWWLASLDERIKATVDICCMTEFEEILRTRASEQHGIYYYVPSLLKHFTTAGINELIAPRAHLCLAGNRDLLTPPAGLDLVDRRLRRAYRAAGAPGAWKMFRQNVGHQETPAMRREIVKFIKKWL